MGLSLGIAQWWIIRRLDAGLYWIISTTIGIAAGTILIPENTSSPLITGAIYGATCGLVQWLQLEKKFKHAIVWPFASIVGFALCFYSAIEVSSSTLISQFSSIESGFLSGAIGGLALGLTTGVALTFMKNSRVEHNS